MSHWSSSTSSNLSMSGCHTFADNDSTDDDDDLFPFFTCSINLFSSLNLSTKQEYKIIRDQSKEKCLKGKSS